MRVEAITLDIPYPHSLEGSASRTPGIHVSGLIRGMAGDFGILDKKYVEDLQLVEVSGAAENWWTHLEPVARLRMSMGLAWEAWYLPRIPGVVYQPGEMSLAGIYMTQDGESLDAVVDEEGLVKGYAVAIHEVKLTYKSLNTVQDSGGISQQWLWMMQTKAYCKARNCRTVYMHVLFVCGDYSYPICPLLFVWRITWEQSEIDEAWDLIVDNMNRFRLEGRL
jgi:hypothetical protein